MPLYKHLKIMYEKPPTESLRHVKKQCPRKFRFDASSMVPGKNKQVRQVIDESYPVILQQGIKASSAGCSITVHSTGLTPIFQGEP